MGNLGLVDKFPSVHVVFKPYRVSDHAPAVLKFPTLVANKPKPFKFFNFLAYKGKFGEVVSNHWNTNIPGHVMYQVIHKMKVLKKPLRKLLHDQGNLHDSVAKLRKELNEVQIALDKNLDDVFLREEDGAYVQAFTDAKLDEERFLKQNVKVDWLEVGDANSAYLHKTIKSKNHRSRIVSILDANDIEITGPCVPDVFVTHYEKFLGSNMPCEALDVGDLFLNQVSDVSNTNMVGKYLMRKLRQRCLILVMIGLQARIGIRLLSSRKGWDIVGMDVSTPLKVNDYRPISCCNVIYKCISKILTNRIIDGIKEVVSQNQSAFVPGRRISDNILITQELMHNYHRDRGPPRCAFKVDIQKAYDTVDLSFLKTILVQFGFHPTMTKWIMACVTSASLSLGINGDIRRFFKGKRGLRQDVDSAQVIMDSLDEFKRVSGLVHSIPKSMAFFCNVLNHVKLDILNIMPFAEGELPVKYLGVPLISSILLNRDCKILMEKAKNRIGDWKNKSLSFAGRLQLLAGMEANGAWLWPHAWLQKALILGNIPAPNLDNNRNDLFQWRDVNGQMKVFSVKNAWEAIRPRGTLVNWFKVVWFTHNIPRHAFHLWLVMRRSLKTQDRMRQWDVGTDVDLNMLRCPLCESQKGTHEHLFFECSFYALVWNSVRHLAGMDHIQPKINDVVLSLKRMANKRTTNSIIGRLILAATSYFIWLERNNRIFKNAKKNPKEIKDIIMVTVRLKLLTFKFKNTSKVNQLLSNWKMPTSFRLYG
ncbi:protein LAZ1 [Tanacetum coccineum]